VARVVARIRLAELAAVGLELPDDAYVFSNDPMAPGRGIPTGPPIRPATWRPRPASSSVSKGCGTTRQASCSRRGSTCVTQQRVLAMAAAERPHCGTTPTRCLKSTGELPPTSHSSPPDPYLRVNEHCGTRRRTASIKFDVALATRFQVVRPRALSALAARMTRIISLMAFTALRLFSAPFHESFHVERQRTSRSCMVRRSLC